MLLGTFDVITEIRRGRQGRTEGGLFKMSTLKCAAAPNNFSSFVNCEINNDSDDEYIIDQ